jgi:hypothetical protein
MRQALRKFILTQPLIRLGCTKIQAGQNLAAQHPGLLESLGWSHRGLALTAMFHLAGFSAMATRSLGQHMQICLQLLEQTMALAMEQLRLTYLTTTTIGLSARRLVEVHQTTTGILGVGELLLGCSFMNHLATQPTALTPLTQQA